MLFGKGKPRASQTGSGESPAKGGVMLRSVASEKPHRCPFPGPRGVQSPLRVAIDRPAQAEFIAHAKDSLNAEICGVLAGRVCEDDEGLFVHVQATIRGAAAAEGSTQVTFTQATWTAIHQTLEKEHPKLKIVGWYHSHPGFGVEFSEMDLFIQRNFFPSPTQIALVTDPLNGAVAICVNTARGIEYLPRFWVDGREQECRIPESVTPAQPTQGVSGPTGDGRLKIQELEARVGQLAVTVEDLRTSLHRFLLFMGALLCIGILSVAGYAIYLQLKGRIEPPRSIAFAPVPVQIGDHTAVLGVNVVSWQIPPELDVMEQAIEEVKRQLEAELTRAGATNPPAASTNAPVRTDRDKRL